MTSDGLNDCVSIGMPFAILIGGLLYDSHVFMAAGVTVFAALLFIARQLRQSEERIAAERSNDHLGE